MPYVGKKPADIIATAVDTTTGTFSGAVSAASVDADGGVTVDNITIDGTEIDLSSGDLTVDVAGDINLDAGGADINLLDDGTQFGLFRKGSGVFVIKSTVSDEDILIRGNDGGSEIDALRIDMSADGHATFKNGVTLTDGNLVVASGHGIDFSANSNASGMSSELLDDYEEGTWTPSFSGLTNTPTYHVLSGRYTKVGRFVMVQFSMQTNQAPTFSDNNAELLITGLPFAIEAVGYVAAVGAVASQAFSFNGSNNSQGTTGQVVSAATTDEQITFRVVSSGNSRGYVRNVGMTGGGIIETTLCYTAT